ncbi:hypothetical protein HRTV-2_gp72 [Halorubrum virus HRTV-2]|nr:hypothetical protein HRTV-2_gp72 [Halorubrum virus HRTV-2]
MSQSKSEGERTHTNSERVVRCPATYPDGSQCEKEVLSRALHLHVLRKSDEAHGESGDIPPNLDVEHAEVVGEKEVEVDYPEEREQEEVARQCPYCQQVFRGKQGLEIHFGQVVGRMNHPKDRDEFPEATECPIVRVDDNKNVIDVVQEGAVMPSTRQRKEGQRREDETVDDFIARLRASGRDDQADAVEEALQEMGEKLS